MVITSIAFGIFLLITFAVFYICPVKFRWLVLLAASIVFYILAGAVKFLIPMVFTTTVIWWAGTVIGKIFENEKTQLAAEGLDKKEKREIKAANKKRARKILIAVLIICIGILCVTKFAKYAVRYMNALANMAAGQRPFSVAWVFVPLGISYYTFSAVSYLLDVYWRRYEYEKNFLRFFLFTIYFPHIIQGPISRYNTLGQNLKKELRWDSQRIIFGIELMIWGFFKKLVIADRLSIFVRAVYNGQAHPGSVFLVAMLCDAFQIYTDFSGYTDIVRGASQVFGVELEQNFNHPFFSKSVPEYWRRWHMTMGGWFKDYVYYSVTMSGFMKKLNKKTMKSLPKRISMIISVAIPVFVTWVLTGLWHGTGKTYLSWGLYYSALIFISNAFQPEFKKINKLLKINTECFSWRLFQMLRTFCIFMGGRLLTSPGSLHRTKIVLYNLIKNFQPWHLVDGSMYGYGLDSKQFGVIYLALLILWAVSNMQERFSVREKLAEQNLVFRWFIIYAGIFATLIFGIYGIGFDAQAFLYTQF